MVRLPAPFLVNEPFPLMTLLKLIASLRLNVIFALSIMLLLLSIEPLVAPSPMTKLPLLTVVAPK